MITIIGSLLNLQRTVERSALAGIFDFDLPKFARLITESYRKHPRPFYDSPEAEIVHWLGVIAKVAPWKNYVQEHAADYSVLFATGSSSGSLPGFKKMRGLAPTGDLMAKEDVALFSGELGSGAVKTGVNNWALSFSNKLGVVLQYASFHFNSKGWSPEKQFEMVAEREQMLDPLLSMHPDAHIWSDQIKLVTEIEEKRIKVWNTLTPLEREFVYRPFPVVYGINEFGKSITENKLDYGIAGVTGELNYYGFIPALSGEIPDEGKMAIYVPQQQSQMVRSYLLEAKLTVIVAPIEGLYFLNSLIAFTEVCDRLELSLKYGY